MILKYRFPDPQVNQILELFLQMIMDFFGNHLVSVVLYGSIVFDDLAPGYGDIDFLALVDENLSDNMCRQLVKLRKPLKNGDFGIIGQMLEGAFLPTEMLDPSNKGKAFWWGTSGERVWENNQLGWLVLKVIRERGIVIWGVDITNDIPEASRMELLGDIRKACKGIMEHGSGGELHSVDWLLTAARLLLYLKEGKLSSKSEAALWGYQNAKGKWRELLPRAKELRLNPSLRDTVESKEWLDGLTQPIKDACAELETELRRALKFMKNGGMNARLEQ